MISHAVRFVVSALVLMLVGFIVPGFSRITFGTALMAAIAIAAIGYVIELVAGRNISPYGHGIVGFIVSAVVIYAVQFFIPGLNVTMIGALLAAVVIGIIDMFVPTEIR
ncbi:MAG: phage holin family protein [Firmicutes bacterium]|nr:phage holin family protein [Bacillota bacterium]